jgi:hypothetical protein
VCVAWHEMNQTTAHNRSHIKWDTCLIFEDQIFFLTWSSSLEKTAHHGDTFLKFHALSKRHMSYISSSCTAKHSFKLNKQSVCRTITRPGISCLYFWLKNRFSHTYRHTQHNRKDTSLWDTLAHRQDHIQTHTAQQEGHITMGYTSA